MALTLLGAIAIIVPVVYNLNQLLRPEQLAEARRRWVESGHGDYDLWMEERKTNAAGALEEKRLVVQVRGGKIASSDGITVENLFDRMAADLAADASRTDRRNYTTATFDDKDGHPTRYVHRIAGSKEQVEWLIRLIVISH